MDGQFHRVDDLGPTTVMHIHEGRTGLRAIVVVDNVACGPAIGGVRMAPDVTVEECLRLARAMTLKSAAAGLPHGGAKAVIVGDPRMDEMEKERCIRAFACAIRGFDEYVPGPDIGTDEVAMSWIHDEIGRGIGRPREVGGIALDEIGATGFGVAVAAEVAAPWAGIELAGARVAVQGYGAVGRHSAHFLAERGAVLVAASDTGGGVVKAAGLDVAALSAHKLAGHSVATFPGGRPCAAGALLEVDCDVFVPAARPDVVTAANAALLRARTVVQGANIPATVEAETILHRRGVVVVPDFIANPGGLICGAAEFRGAGEQEAFAMIDQKVRANTESVLQRAAADGVPPREVAVAMATERVRTAMAGRRWW
jgi:glutamate dehydrogenase/leucine dehydrogenase